MELENKNKNKNNKFYYKQPDDEQDSFSNQYVKNSSK